MDDLFTAWEARSSRPLPPPDPFLPREAWGNGDYFVKSEYDGAEMARERREEVEERFTPFDGLLPADLQGKPAPYPWVLARRERVAIARECMAAGLRGSDVDRAIDLTLFARRFAEWAEDGFPITKG